MEVSAQRRLILFGLVVAAVLFAAAVLQGCVRALLTPSETAENDPVYIGNLNDFPPGTVRGLELPLSVELPPFGIYDFPNDVSTPTPGPVSPLWLYVVNDQESGLLALSGHSPYRGCQIQWQEANGHFADPCHAAKFTRNGEWIEGASPRGLDSFPVQIDDEGDIFIDASTLIPGSPLPTATTTFTPAPTLTRSATPQPTSTLPATPQLSRQALLESMQSHLNEGGFAALEYQMRSPFITGIYPVATSMERASTVIIDLQFRLLSARPDIAFWEVDPAALPASLTAAALFGAEASQVTVVGSSGWGMTGSSEALLYLIEAENGRQFPCPASGSTCHPISSRCRWWLSQI